MRSPFSRSYGCNLPSSFKIVLSNTLVYSTRPPVSVLVRPNVGAISWNLSPCTSNPIRKYKTQNPSLTHWLRNINLISIDYAFRPRLRSRLTLRRLALRRKPWTSGDNVSHIVYRYSCQHSLFRYLQQTSQFTFNGLRNAPLPLIFNI